MDAINDAAVRAAIEGVLSAASDLPPTIGENLPFNPSSAGSTLRTRLFRHPKRRYAGFSCVEGFLHIEVWCPADSGPEPAESIASGIEALFTPFVETDEKLSGLVHVQNAAILNGAKDDTGAFWVLPIQVDWWVAV
ncbi:hypothetical protein J2847_005893 [Azospirillum agricola]|uniref:hypothetical protein n=1 Tax=Azospirillum agricola TaxID=1720247 RepID=UPI001AE40514|nr:hypothetical protein [Azospirillum agricola]MBP2232564.1 hypothetical protein [Azospirillum agricola]